MPLTDFSSWKPSDFIAAFAAVIAAGSLAASFISIWLSGISVRRATPRPVWKAGWHRNEPESDIIFRARNIGEGHARDVGFAATVSRSGKPVRGDGQLTFKDLGPGQTYEFPITRDGTKPFLLVRMDETVVAAMLWHQPPKPHRRHVKLYYLGKRPKLSQRRRDVRYFRGLGTG